MDALQFQSFYEQTAKPLWAYLRHMTDDDGLAEELAQEAYFRLLKAKQLPTEDAALKAYLFQIGTRLVIDRRRRSGRRRRLLREYRTPDPSAAPNIAVKLDMEACFRELSTRQRSLLWLAHVDGYSHREIADMMDLKEKSIKVLLYRARKKLAAVLERAGFNPNERP